MDAVVPGGVDLPEF